jgi:hypothetical protein
MPCHPLALALRTLPAAAFTSVGGECGDTALFLFLKKIHI